MKNLLIFSAATLFLALACSSSYAAGGSVSGVTQFSNMNLDAKVPACPADEVLTFNNGIWGCVKNFKTGDCSTDPALPAINSIDMNGVVTCGTFTPPAIGGCPAGSALQAIPPSGGTPGCVAIFRPPPCPYPDVLTSHDGVNFICEAGTGKYSVGNIDLSLAPIVPTCNSANTGAFGDAIPWPTIFGNLCPPPDPSKDPDFCPGGGVLSFSADCTSACNVWCRNLAVDPATGHPTHFNNGIVSEYNAPSKEGACTCFK